MNNNWQALRTVSSIMRIGAYIVAGVGALVAIGSLCAGGTIGANLGLGGAGIFIGLLYAILAILGFGWSALGLFAGAELIMLLISVENNTTTAARAATGMPPTVMPPTIAPGYIAPIPGYSNPATGYTPPPMG